MKHAEHYWILNWPIEQSKCHLSKTWMKKEHLFSVRGFGMETSNFAPKRCLRESIVRFFDARSARMLRMSLRTLWNRWFTKNVYFDEFLKEICWIFTLLLTFYQSFLSKTGLTVFWDSFWASSLNGHQIFYL